jgi:hypothetical protein
MLAVSAVLPDTMPDHPPLLLNLWLTADYLSVGGASPWGLVLQRRALSSMIPEVLHWITQHT